MLSDRFFAVGWVLVDLNGCWWILIDALLLNASYVGWWDMSSGYAYEYRNNPSPSTFWPNGSKITAAACLPEMVAPSMLSM